MALKVPWKITAARSEEEDSESLGLQQGFLLSRYSNGGV